MPYIRQSQRATLDPAIDGLIDRVKLVCDRDGDEPDGMLNYAMTKLLLGTVCKELRYASLERAIGCLECCKLEMYRRLAGPYEDMKAKANGEVYL